MLTSMLAVSSFVYGDATSLLACEGVAICAGE